VKYTNVLLTVIAILLAAIVAKLYVPALQEVGTRLSPITRGEFFAARQIKNANVRQAKLKELREDTSMIWVTGGDVEVSNTVQVEGEVTIERRW